MMDAAYGWNLPERIHLLQTFQLAQTTLIIAQNPYCDFFYNTFLKK